MGEEQRLLGPAWASVGAPLLGPVSGTSFSTSVVLRLGPGDQVGNEVTKRVVAASSACGVGGEAEPALRVLRLGAGPV